MNKVLMTIPMVIVLAGAGLQDAQAAAYSTQDLAESFCLSTNNDLFHVPSRDLGKTCSCVGVVANMNSYKGNLSETDAIMKGFHGCVNGNLISRYYEKLAWKATGSLTADFRKLFAECIGTQGVIRGTSFATNSRTYEQHLKGVMDSCQYIVGIDAFLRILSVLAR